MNVVAPAVPQPGQMFGTTAKTAEEDAPRLPGAGEAGDRGLPRGERVALDLHVEEVLDRDADDREVQEPDARVGADVRPQDVLAGADADARQDHARPEHLAQRQGLRHVAVLHRRQVVAAHLRRVLRLARSSAPAAEPTPVVVVLRVERAVPANVLTSPAAPPAAPRPCVADVVYLCPLLWRDQTPEGGANSASSNGWSSSIDVASTLRNGLSPTNAVVREQDAALGVDDEFPAICAPAERGDLAGDGVVAARGGGDQQRPAAERLGLAGRLELHQPRERLRVGPAQQRVAELERAGRLGAGVRGLAAGSGSTSAGRP